MKTSKITQPFVSKIRKELITVISDENKSLNNIEEKNGVETVSTQHDFNLSANVTGFPIVQSSLNDFDNTYKSAGVGHLRGAQ